MVQAERSEISEAARRSKPTMAERTAAPDRSHASHATAAFQKLSHFGARRIIGTGRLDVEEQSSAVPDQIDADPRQGKQGEDNPAAWNAGPGRSGRIAFVLKPVSLRVLAGFFLGQCHLSLAGELNRSRFAIIA